MSATLFFVLAAVLLVVAVVVLFLTVAVGGDPEGRGAGYVIPGLCVALAFAIACVVLLGFGIHRALTG